MYQGGGRRWSACRAMIAFGVEDAAGTPAPASESANDIKILRLLCQLIQRMMHAQVYQPAGKLSSLIIHYPVQSSIVTTILIICGETRRRNLPVTTIVLVNN
jgi:hypothetical protein